MPNPLSKASEQVGRVAVRAVDYVVENRLVDAQSMVDKARSSLPGANERVIADFVVSKVARELATLGALSGAVAVAPGVGTGAALATGAADVGLSFGRIATMAMAVGLAYGLDLDELQTRKAFVYGVLSGSSSQLSDKERKAGEMKKLLGKQAVGRKGAVPAANRVNEVVAAKVGSKVLEKLVTKEAALKAATLLPLGLGAGVGAVGNRALVNSVGRTAKLRAAAELEADAARARSEQPTARRGIGSGSSKVRAARARLRGLL